MRLNLSKNDCKIGYFIVLDKFGCEEEPVEIETFEEWLDELKQVNDGNFLAYFIVKAIEAILEPSSQCYDKQCASKLNAIIPGFLEALQGEDSDDWKTLKEKFDALRNDPDLKNKEKEWQKLHNRFFEIIMQPAANLVAQGYEAYEVQEMLAFWESGEYLFPYNYPDTNTKNHDLQLR